MNPQGCFGSSLAFEPKSKACLACSARAECSAEVDNRYRPLIQTLARYQDNRGNPIALRWMKPEDRRRYNKRKKDRQLANASTVTLNNPAGIHQLMTDVDPRGQSMVRRLITAFVNPYAAPIEQLGVASPIMQHVIAQLKTGAKTVDGMVRELTANSDCSASSAQRDIYAAISVLTACQRAQRVGRHVELL